MAYRINEILNKDSSYQYVPYNSQTAAGLAFLRLFGKNKAQNKKREEYESTAKYFYNLGYRDGQDNIENPINQTVPFEEYDFLMKLCGLMGVSFSYILVPPYLPKEYTHKYNPGLNVIKIRDNSIPVDTMVLLENIVNSVKNVRDENNNR